MYHAWPICCYQTGTQLNTVTRSHLGRNDDFTNLQMLWGLLLSGIDSTQEKHNNLHCFPCLFLLFAELFCFGGPVRMWWFWRSATKNISPNVIPSCEPTYPTYGRRKHGKIIFPATFEGDMLVPWRVFPKLTWASQQGCKLITNTKSWRSKTSTLSSCFRKQFPSQTSKMRHFFWGFGRKSKLAFLYCFFSFRGFPSFRRFSKTQTRWDSTWSVYTWNKALPPFAWFVCKCPINLKVSYFSALGWHWLYINSSLSHKNHLTKVCFGSQIAIFSATCSKHFAPLRTSCWLETNKCSSLANPVLSWLIQGGLMIVNLTRKSRLNLVKRGAKISEHDSFAMGFYGESTNPPLAYPLRNKAFIRPY